MSSPWTQVACRASRVRANDPRGSRRTRSRCETHSSTSVHPDQRAPNAASSAPSSGGQLTMPPVPVPWSTAQVSTSESPSTARPLATDPRTYTLCSASP